LDQERITEEAVHWLDALKRDDADWDGFTRWLEASPDHREAYDSVALLDERVDAHRDALAAVLPSEAAPARPVRRWLAWGGGAGALAAAVAAGLMLPVAPAEADQVFRTAPGQTRAVALADGSRIELASASTLTVKAGGQRLALDGTASFAVPHRPDRTLTVEAGGLTVQDIGTTFEIATGGQAVRVQVAEGQVSVAAPELASAVRVAGGRKLVVDRSLGTAELQPVREYASWKHGRLVYDNAPLPLVAAEVGRYAGRRVAVAPDLAGRRFSGVLTIGDGSRLVGDLARLMDLDARGDGSAVRLAAHRAR
jgi:transmembrane sensor